MRARTRSQYNPGHGWAFMSLGRGIPMFRFAVSLSGMLRPLVSVTVVK